MSHSGERHGGSADGSLERRIGALEDRLDTLIDAVDTLARGLEDGPLAEPPAHPDEAARRSRELLLLAKRRSAGPD